MADKRPILYKIAWEKTQLDYTLENGVSGGRLEKVSGTLYQEGKPASTFTADLGFADKAKHTLRLEGHVQVVSPKPNATLTCNRMEWNTDEKLLKAFGSVTITFRSEPEPETKAKATGGTIGPMDEMWCRPNLNTAGTPGFLEP